MALAAHSVQPVAMLPSASMSEALTADSFAAHQGSEFAVQLPGSGTLTLTLTGVDRFALQPGAPREEPFSVEFVGPPQPVLPQAIYFFEHAVMGRFDLFIVPLGPISRDDPRMRYEAVFN